MIASVGGTVADAMVFPLHLTLGTHAHAFGQALCGDVIQARRIVGEFVVEVSHGVAKLFGDVLFDFSVKVHNDGILPNALLVVKG